MASGGVHHEVGADQAPGCPAAGCLPVPAARPDAGDGVVAAFFQGDGLVSGQEGDLGVGAQPVAYHRVGQVAAGAEQRQARVEAGQPAAGAEQQHVLGHADADRSGAGEVGEDAGEELLQALLGGGGEAVGVAGLGQAPAAPGSAGKPVAFDHGDPVHEVGQGPCGGEPGEAGADHDGVAVAACVGVCVRTQLGCPPRALWLHHAVRGRPRAGRVPAARGLPAPPRPRGTRPVARGRAGDVPGGAGTPDRREDLCRTGG